MAMHTIATSGSAAGSGATIAVNTLATLKAVSNTRTPPLVVTAGDRLHCLSVAGLAVGPMDVNIFQEPKLVLTIPE